MEGHMRKVLFVKGGQGGGTTPRVSLPMEYVKELGITKESPEVKITLAGKKIIIEKAQEGKQEEEK